MNNTFHKHEMLKLNIPNQFKPAKQVPRIVHKPVIQPVIQPVIKEPHVVKISPSILLNSHTSLSSKIRFKSFASDQNCQKIYSISNIGIYISSDYGANWEISSAPTNLFWTAISCDYSGQNVIAAALQSSSVFEILIYYSSDSGKTWNTSCLNNKNGFCVSITYNLSSFLALTTTGNIYESINNGLTWNNKMLIYNGCNSIVSNYNGQYLFMSSSLLNGGGIYISNDYGCSWSKSATLDDCNSITCSYSGQYLAAVCNSKNSGGIHTSNDYGKTWIKRVFFNNNWINITSDNSGQYLAATSFCNNNGDIYLSNDFGTTWVKSNTDINNWKLVVYNKNGSFLLATTFNCLDEEMNINTYKAIN